MNVMEYKIVDSIPAETLEVDDIIKVNNELMRVVSIEENVLDDASWLEIFYMDDYGDIEYEIYNYGEVVSIWLPFD